MKRLRQFILILISPLFAASCLAQMPILPGLTSVNLGGGVFGTINVDLVYTGNYSTAGTAMTNAIGDSSTVSNNCTPTTCAQWQNLPGGGNFLVGANQSACSNLGAVAVNGGGPTYPAGTLAYNNIEYKNLGDTVVYWNIYLSTGTVSANNLTIGVCLASVPSPASLVIDLMELTDTYGGDAWVQAKQCQDSNEGFALESSALTSGGHSSPCIEPSFPATVLASINYNESQAGLGFYGTYASGGSVTGSTGNICLVNFTGGSFGMVALTGSNSLTGATVYGVATSGSPWGTAPTSGTLANGPPSGGSPTCSGTITVSGATLSGVATFSLHDATTGTLIGQEQMAVPYHASPFLDSLYIGNGENYNGSGTWYLQNLLMTWTGTPPQDMYSSW